MSVLHPNYTNLGDLGLLIDKVGVSTGVGQLVIDFSYHRITFDLMKVMSVTIQSQHISLIE